MQLVPVMDLARGMAVQGSGGDRARYRPVESVLTPGRPGDPLALIQAYRDTVGARECYVADLDAIQGGTVQRDLIRDLAGRAAPCGLLVDAGAADAAAARALLDLGARSVVAGLETLRGFDDLADIVAAAGTHRVAFSLDLRHGAPALRSGGAPGIAGLAPLELADRAVEAGARTILVLDVGRVGTGRGVDLDLLRALRRRFPSERLLAGGGIAGEDDLGRLAGAGCDAALVATALHRGRLGQSSASASRQVADCP
jgi:phosphoribosylformimino-5-aminoimidazole carboxamide ribotide isomerase